MSYKDLLKELMPRKEDGSCSKWVWLRPFWQLPPAAQKWIFSTALANCILCFPLRRGAAQALHRRGQEWSGRVRCSGCCAVFPSAAASPLHQTHSPVTPLSSTLTPPPPTTHPTLFPNLFHSELGCKWKHRCEHQLWLHADLGFFRPCLCNLLHQQARRQHLPTAVVWGGSGGKQQAGCLQPSALCHLPLQHQQFSSTCHLCPPTSATRCRDLWAMKRPNDISHQVAIIGAVGDSISAGVGANALNIIDVFNEVRRRSRIRRSNCFKGPRAFLCDRRRGKLVVDLQLGEHSQRVQPRIGGFFSSSWTSFYNMCTSTNLQCITNIISVLSVTLILGPGWCMLFEVCSNII